MEVLAKHKNARMSAQKARLMADLIRPMSIENALSSLKFSRKRAAKFFLKVLESAIANAEHNEGADVDDLKIAAVFVDEGPVMKRWHARAKGRGARILKRTCHITVKLADLK